MKLPNINYQWNVEALAKQDASAPVRLAQEQANLLGQQAGVDAKWAGAANANSNTARAWGKVYEAAGSLPDEFSRIAEKYDSARADAKMVSKMTQFKKKFDDPSKKFFTPEELTAEGIEFESTGKDINGQDFQRTEIPKHEVYAQAHSVYTDNAMREAEAEFSWLAYDQQWKQKTQMTIDQSSADANSRAGQMAFKYLVESQDAEVKAYLSQGEYGAALKSLEGCPEGNKTCNAKRLEVVIAKDVGGVQDALMSGDVKKMTMQRNLIADGNTRIPKDKSLALINQLNTKIKTQSETDEKEQYSNMANKQLNEMAGQSWKAQQDYGRSIPDAKAREEFNKQLKLRKSADETNIKLEEEQKFDDSVKAVQEGKLNVVPADMLNGRHRQSIQAMLTAKAKGQDIKTDPVEYGKLMSMGRNKETEKQFLKVDLPSMRKFMSNSDYQKAVKLQDDIRNQKVDAGMTTLSNRINDSLYSALGSKSEADLGTGEKRRKFFILSKQIEDTLMPMREAGNVTREMENKVIADSISSYTKEEHWYGDDEYDLGDFNEEELRVSGDIFKAHGIAPTNELRLYIKKYPTISDELMFNNIPVTPDNIRKRYSQLER